MISSASMARNQSVFRKSPTSVDRFDDYSFWNKDFDFDNCEDEDSLTCHEPSIHQPHPLSVLPVSLASASATSNTLGMSMDRTIDQYLNQKYNNGSSVDQYLNQKYDEYFKCAPLAAGISSYENLLCKENKFSCSEADSMETIDMETCNDDFAPIDLSRATSDDLLKFKPLLCFEPEFMFDRLDSKAGDLDSFKPIARSPRPYFAASGDAFVKSDWKALVHQKIKAEDFPAASTASPTEGSQMNSLVQDPMPEWDDPAHPTMFRLVTIEQSPCSTKPKTNKKITFAPHAKTSDKKAPKKAVPSPLSSAILKQKKSIRRTKKVAKASPAKASPAKVSPAKASPAKASSAKVSPAKASPAKASPAKVSPAKASPAKVSPAKGTGEEKTPAKKAPASLSVNKRIDPLREPRFRKYQAENWSIRFKEVKQFVEHHDHCMIPHDYPANQALARWAKRQRYQYKLFLVGSNKSSMTEERLLALEDLEFCWDAHTSQWQERFLELRAFVKDEGHANVPTQYSKNRQLATWVKCQRRQHKLWKAGDRANITEDRMKLLESVGFKWVIERR
jgi:hypothetical protein